MDDMEHNGKEHHLISTSSILIFSGFLLGVSVSQPLGELAFYVFASGIAGMVAYLTFEMTNMRQERQLICHDQQLMEARLLRHVGLSLQQISQDRQEQDRLLEWLNRETESLSQ